MIDSVTAKTGVLADPKAAELDKLKAVAKQFEAVFMREIIGSMREAKLSDDVMGSDATDQFTEMQDSHIADNLASKSMFGIGDMLVKQFAARVSPVKAGTPAAAASASAPALKAPTTGKAG